MRRSKDRPLQKGHYKSQRGRELRTVGLASALLTSVFGLLLLLLPLLLLSVALFHLLGLLLVALFGLLPSCVIGIALGDPPVLLLLFSLELLMLLLLFVVELVFLLTVFLVLPGIAGVRRRRPIVRRNVPGVTEGRTVGIVYRVWRTIAVVPLV